MASQDPSQQKKQAEFERILTAAHVHRRRGDYSRAEELVTQALDIDASNLEAREFAADLLCARGKLEEAAECYKSILAEDKTVASAEEKYAKAILQIAEGRRQKDLLQDMLDNPSRSRGPKRNPVIAGVLSIAPGFGQIYCGQIVKGIVLFCAAMLCWMLFYAAAPPVAANIDPQDRITEFMTNLSALPVLLGCIAVFIHVYAFVDAPVTASKMRSADESAALGEDD